MTSTADGLSYNGLNRLTQVDASNTGRLLSLTKTVTYDAIGNITSKSDVGDYAYDPCTCMPFLHHAGLDWLHCC